MKILFFSAIESTCGWLEFRLTRIGRASLRPLQALRTYSWHRAALLHERQNQRRFPIEIS